MEFCDPRVQNIQSLVGEMLKFNVMHHSLIFYGSCQRDNCENRTKSEEEKDLQEHGGRPLVS